MAGDRMAHVADAKRAKTGDESGRSTIAFPLEDLANAIDLARAIHNHAGLVDCEDDQLATWTNQSPNSPGYRAQVEAAQLFGLIDWRRSFRCYRLSELGRMIVEPQRTREARVRAFLNVPLYAAVYEKYEGGVLPPTAVFERDIQALGVAEKTKDRARRVLERSADQASFFEHGRDRLVRPRVSVRENADAPPAELPRQEPIADKGTGGGSAGDDRAQRLHPFIQGLLDTLPGIPDPKQKPEWPVADRAKWLQTAANIFDLIYAGEGGVKVEATSAQRSPRPGEP